MKNSRGVHGVHDVLVLKCVIDIIKRFSKTFSNVVTKYNTKHKILKYLI